MREAFFVVQKQHPLIPNLNINFGDIVVFLYENRRSVPETKLKIQTRRFLNQIRCGRKNIELFP